MLINFRYAVMPLSRNNVIYYIIYTTAQALFVYPFVSFYYPCNTKTTSISLIFNLLQKPISALLQNCHGNFYAN